jgi:hypothetical protein
MLTGLGNPKAYFLSGIKAFFIEHRGYNDLWHAAYLYTILIYRDNGGAAADDTAKGYMRRVTGGGSTTSSRWLSNEGCLPLREKATRALHYSTWHIWGELLPPPAQVRVQVPAAAAAWKKDGFEFLYFAAKTVGCAVKW